MITQYLGLPLYLDSIGTVLVAVLAGPAAGLTTGALSSVVWGLLNPAALPFAAVSALTGLLAGLLKSERLWTWILSGAFVGLICGALAAPIAAFVYGGTGAIVSAFREMGNSLLQSVTLQSFISDPLDKAAVFAIVYFVVRALPARVTQ